MGFKDAIGIFFNTLPIIRTIWRWLLERGMEINIQSPHSHALGRFPITSLEGDKPFYFVNVGENPHIFMWADLVLLNHRADRLERIIKCSLHLKKGFLLFWDKTITEAEVKECIPRRGISDDYRQINNVELPPISPPIVLTVQANESIITPITSLPRRMKLVLEFDMVGPVRKIKKNLINIYHNVKSDKENLRHKHIA